MSRDECVKTFARKVRQGLLCQPQKYLCCEYLYDDLGSALFDALCLLPEYGLSRAGERLLQAHGAELLHHLRAPLCIVELGSGSGQKTQLLLHTLASAVGAEALHYVPVDISSSALKVCAQGATKIARMRVTPWVCDYAEGLVRAAARRIPGEQMLVLFLGSTIGNFARSEADQFLSHMRTQLQPGDGLFLATDLVKSPEIMERAYDDALGITAAFNRNILLHINRVLGADFNLDDFAHEAHWNHQAARVEMHLRARRPARVRIPAAEVDVAIAKDETIWTESSHKFTLPMLADLAHDTGFSPVAQWLDASWPFAHNLWKVEAG